MRKRIAGITTASNCRCHRESKRLGIIVNNGRGQYRVGTPEDGTPTHAIGTSETQRTRTNTIRFTGIM